MMGGMSSPCHGRRGGSVTVHLGNNLAVTAGQGIHRRHSLRNNRSGQAAENGKKLDNREVMNNSGEMFEKSFLISQWEIVNATECPKIPATPFFRPPNSQNGKI